MNPFKLVGALVLLSIIAGGAWLLWGAGEEKRGDRADTQEYLSEDLGLSFTYPSSYLLRERDTGTPERKRYTITLIENTPGNRALLSGEVPGEGPPAITIELFQNNLDHYTTEGWIRGVSDSNFKLSAEGKLSTTTISGEEALSYRWSGLYEGTTIAQARPAWVYAFSVTYLEPGAPIVQDFVALRDSATIVE